MKNYRVMNSFRLQQPVCNELLQRDNQKTGSINKHRNGWERAVTMKRESCLKTMASVVSSFFFNRFNSLAFRGQKQLLTWNELWGLDPENKSDIIAYRFESAWQAELKKPPAADDVKRKVNILKVLFSVFGGYYAIGSVLTVLPHVLDVLAPLILSLLITFVKDGGEAWEGYAYATALFLTTAVALLTRAQVSHIFFVTSFRVKTALICAAYKKILNLSRAARAEISSGEIVNLVSVDVQKVLDIIPYMYQVWVFPLQITIGLIFLWRLMGIATLAGVAVTLALIPLQGGLGMLAKRYQLSQMRSKDERVKLLAAIISGIKILKFHVWEEAFLEKLLLIREKEMSCLRKSACLSSMQEFLSFGSQFLVALATFGAHVMLNDSNSLDARTAFVTLSLLNVIAFPLKTLPMTAILAVKAAVSLGRLNKFLNAGERDTFAASHEVIGDQIYIDGCSFSWKSEVDGVLKDISLKVTPGSLVAVVGPVASGKSSLIAALLGELHPIDKNGKISIWGTVGYVAQQAWILNATVRENILFGTEYDHQRYFTILEACCLFSDLNDFPDGDRTLIGERGVNLSGGQKQRISIARAVYSNADMYFLDDPLSAVDAHVGKAIFDKVIGPGGLLRNKTRIFVTHGNSFLHQVDKILVLKNGRISAAGNLGELVALEGNFPTFLSSAQKSDVHVENHSDDQARQLSGTGKTDIGVRDERGGSSQTLYKETVEVGPITSQGAWDQLGTSGIPWSVYVNYLRAGNLFVMIGSFIMYFAYQGFALGGNFRLSVWSSESTANDTQTDSRYHLSIYACFGVLQSVSVLLAAILLSLGALLASSRLHRRMLNRVLRAPMWLFDVTPTGWLTNRFVKDVDILDTAIAPTLRLWMTDFVMVVATVVTIVYVMPLFLAICLPGLVVFYTIQKFYIPTARQLMRLESATRSPIYSHFYESIAGVTTIRAYGQEDRFLREAMRKVDENQTCLIPLLVAYRWLAVRLEGVASLVKFAVAILVVTGRGSITPGLAGLALTYAMDVTYNLGRLIRSYCDIETNIVAVEHIQKFCQIPQEASSCGKIYQPPSGWPNAGSIQYENYSASYREELPAALRDITCTITSGEKVGVVGRTGAGKSSLALSIFRIIEPSAGRIIIDGEDLGKLSLEDLRSKLTIIPQDPVLFTGSLRFNLDPFGRYGDDEIWRALELANLKTFVSTLPAQLDQEIMEDGSNLSVGQKQMVCLSRALLQRSKILVLDEATATVDLETDELIQATIRNEFKNSTVITIAHRLNTVLDYDRIMVLDEGRLKECGPPADLLRNENSLFWKLAMDAGILIPKAVL